MIKGRNISIFLMNGTAIGPIKCSLSNWTGVVYRIHRSELEELSEREHLKQTGVYFLFGKTDDTEQRSVYVGQASIRKNGKGLLNRLKEHRLCKDKEFWTEAVVLTTINNTFGPTEISYLEHCFTFLAREAKRYQVKNCNEPFLGNITEEKEVELARFIENTALILSVLGYKLFDKIDKKVNDEDYLYMNYKDARGIGIITDEGFAVLTGSKVSSNITRSIPQSAVINRQRYSTFVDNHNLLTTDILFTSPSAAAAFIGGASLSGNVVWKNRQGTPLKEIIT